MMLSLCVICLVWGVVFFLNPLRGGGTISREEWGLSVFSLKHFVRDSTSCLFKAQSPSVLFGQWDSKKSASGSSPTIGKRSGSAAEDCSACQQGRTKELAPAGGHPSRRIGRSQELAPRWGRQTSSIVSGVSGGISRCCHIPSAEGVSDAP